MEWTVHFTGKAAKQASKLAKREKDLLTALVQDLRIMGPVLPHWKNYSKLGKTTYHCHLNYRWVACWEVGDSRVKLIEIYYVGSRENATY